MSYNTFGHLLRLTTWGESHGVAIGGVLDGCPPNIRFSRNDIQHALDKRRPGTSKYVTQRSERDRVKVLSGVLPDADNTQQDARGDDAAYVSTGTPISLLIENEDQRAKDYSQIRHSYRPGHADYTYDAKYGLRDYRGGGRSSARETAMRVAAAAIAVRIVPDLRVRGALVQMGEMTIDRDNWDWEVIGDNPFFCPDAQAAGEWEVYLDGIRKDGSSIGAVVEVVADGVPAGLGAPVYGKLDQDIGAAMLSINAVKGVEIGAGFAAAAQRGEEHGDEIRRGEDGRAVFLSNHAGGILGGISSGQPIVARFVVKPTSSILTPRRSITDTGENIDITTRGRHDPCVGIRAVPVGEAMMALVLADHYLRHRGQTGAKVDGQL